MNRKRWIALLLAMVMALGLVGCGGKTPDAAPDPEPDQSTDGAVTVTDMIGREVTVIPGSYQRVVCIGAGALRIYSYVGDAALLCGVEDIDNTTLSERPKMFDNVARPYVMAYGDVFAQLPSCGVGGPNAQAAEAEKILACQPDIIISEYKDVEKADALQEQVGVPVITTSTGPDGVFDDAFRTCWASCSDGRSGHRSSSPSSTARLRSSPAALPVWRMRTGPACTSVGWATGAPRTI